MKHKLPPHIVAKIEDVISCAEHKNANFDGLSPPGDPWEKGAHGYDTATDFINERTRLFRNSWLVSPLEGVLDWSEGNDGEDDWMPIVQRLREPLVSPALVEEAARTIERMSVELEELKAFKNAVIEIAKKSNVTAG